MKIHVIYVLKEIRRLLDREAGTSSDEEDSPEKENLIERTQ